MSGCHNCVIWTLIIVSTLASSENSDVKEDEDLITFKKLFQQKRLHQLSAIKQLMNMNAEQQVKLLDSMLQKMTEVLTESQATLSSAGIEFADLKLPSEQNDKTALALVLENTCLACDILLRFPNYMHKKLQTQRHLDTLYKWGLGYINETVSFVMDEPTQRLFFLAGQELELTSKDEAYVNPYKKPPNEPKKIMFVDPPETPKKKRKNKIKRGPKMTKTEL